MSSALGPTFGSWLVSAFLETMLYGMGLLQTWLYFHWYPSDNWGIKTTVLLVATLETLQMSLFLRGTYTHFVSDFGNFLDLWVISWEDYVQLLLGYFSAFAVQLYFAYCIYILNKNRIVSFAIVALVLVQFGFGIAQMVLSRRVGSFSKLDQSNKIVIIVESSVTLVCDIMIVVALCVSLGHKKTVVKSTKSMLQTLTVYAVNRGVLTAVWAALTLIMYLRYPNTFYFFIGLFISSKMYMNSMLATLNSREYVRNQAYPSTKGWRSIHLGTSLHEPNVPSSRTPVTGARESPTAIDLAPSDYEMNINKSATLADMI